MVTTAGNMERRVGGTGATKAEAGSNSNKPQESKELRDERRRRRQGSNVTHNNFDAMILKKTNEKKRQSHDHSGRNLSSETELPDRGCAPDSS